MQLKVTFKEGGAFDFHTNFERIKERLRDAVDNSPEGRRGVRGVNMASVHLDELPAYEGPRNPNPTVPSDEGGRQNAQEAGPEPSGPPPGYEEVQQQSVAHELEERLRRSS